METILESYYANNAKKLHTMVDKILKKLGFCGLVDPDDFYSLANEIFVDVIERYDNSKDFDGFLYSCLTNKFKTEMTRRNRYKRKSDKDSISWETPIDEETGTTIGEFITDTRKAEHYDIDKTFFEDDGEKFTEKMLKYISRLSKLQREVVKLIIAGYIAEEIKQILHISEAQYQDCMVGVRAYRNVSVLF